MENVLFTKEKINALRSSVEEIRASIISFCKENKGKMISYFDRLGQKSYCYYDEKLDKVVTSNLTPCEIKLTTDVSYLCWANTDEVLCIGDSILFGHIMDISSNNLDKISNDVNSLTNEICNLDENFDSFKTHIVETCNLALTKVVKSNADLDLEDSPILFDTKYRLTDVSILPNEKILIEYIDNQTFDVINEQVQLLEQLPYRVILKLTKEICNRFLDNHPPTKFNIF